jgi:uncharacterized MnhB-related membrane protein
MKGFDFWMDALLGLLLLVLAGRALTAPRLYQSAILFVAFGLTLALAWARLQAPDVALAEAAIGAGLLGVLLIDALRVFERNPPGRDTVGAGVVTGSTAAVIVGSGSDPAAHSSRGPKSSQPMRRGLTGATTGTTTVVGSLCGLLGLLLVVVILDLPKSGGLTMVVAAQMPHSGVDHPVTAVLLNFRGYDTWLEIGVLLVAMWGILCAGGMTRTTLIEPEPSPGLLQDGLVRGLIPLILLVAGYLLWMGKSGPGGAFQSGVVLGAAGILWRLNGQSFPDGLPDLAWKAGLVCGFGFLLLIGMCAMLAGGAFLEYPREWAGALILVAEGAAAVSIGFTLICLFAWLRKIDRRTPSMRSTRHAD